MALACSSWLLTSCILIKATSSEQSPSLAGICPGQGTAQIVLLRCVCLQLGAQLLAACHQVTRMISSLLSHEVYHLNVVQHNHLRFFSGLMGDHLILAGCRVHAQDNRGPSPSPRSGQTAGGGLSFSAVPGIGEITKHKWWVWLLVALGGELLLSLAEEASLAV